MNTISVEIGNCNYDINYQTILMETMVRIITENNNPIIEQYMNLIEMLTTQNYIWILTACCQLTLLVSGAGIIH